MSKIKINVIRENRIYLSLILGSLPPIYAILFNIGMPTRLIPFIVAPTIFILIYIIGVGKLILDYSNNQITFNWKRRILFENKEYKPINVRDIKTLVVERETLIRRIITEDRNIEIGVFKPTSEEYQSFVYDLIQEVQNNNNRIMTKKEYLNESADYGFSFKLTFVLAFCSLFIMLITWDQYSYYSFLLLILPLISYIIHLYLRKKNNRYLNY